LLSNNREGCAIFYTFWPICFARFVAHRLQLALHISQLEFPHAKSCFSQLEPHDEHVVSETSPVWSTSPRSTPYTPHIMCMRETASGCQSGYAIRKGNEHRTCQSDGTWTGGNVDHTVCGARTMDERGTNIFLSRRLGAMEVRAASIDSVRNSTLKACCRHRWATEFPLTI
jgi:hypothetical protein